MRSISLLLPIALSATAAAQDSIRITEWMYKGNLGEFVELTNTGAASVDMTGWSLDDDSALPGTVDLTSLGILSPGESVVVTDVAAALFEVEWGITGVKIVTQTLANLGRNDQVNIFDSAGILHDQLTYGDEDLPGSPRTDTVSASACDEVLGANYAWGWTLSALGDAAGSTLSLSGDIGNPGAFTSGSCAIYGYCGPSQPNSVGLSAGIFPEGSRTVLDNDLTLTAYQMPGEKFGYFLTSTTQAFVSNPPGSEGNLCLGGNIGRYSKSVLNSGDSGSFSLLIDLTSMPVNPPQAVLPGETWNFSAWYRDNNPTPTSNFTDAVSITFD